MRILFYGSRGWIGQQFCEYLQTHSIDVIHGGSRVDDIEAIDREITTVKPTHIVSFIGRTSGGGINTIDYLEQPGKLVENVRDNLFSPMVLGLICQKHNIHLCYLGTGCIFNYDDTHNTDTGYTEDDLPNFFGSSYSTVKGFTDRLMHIIPVLNLRIRMPITSQNHPRNFITKITNYEKICNIPNSMTVLTDFFPVWYDMLLNHKTGTYNCTNPGTIEHDEILEMYRNLVDKDFTWKNFTLEEQNRILASGRSNNFLDTSKIQREYPELPTIKESVRNVLHNWH